MRQHNNSKSLGVSLSLTNLLPTLLFLNIDKCSACSDEDHGAAGVPCDDDEEDIFDIHRVGEDGQVVLHASYRVDRDGNVHWLTPDGKAPAF